MAEWPSTDELAQVLNVENVEDWQTTLDRVRLAAIEYVKLKVGGWVDGADTPDEALAQAALRMMELIAQRPGATISELGTDPTFSRLLYGHRRRFGIA
jgi:hypothetical protein